VFQTHKKLSSEQRRVVTVKMSHSHRSCKCRDFQTQDYRQSFFKVNVCLSFASRLVNVYSPFASERNEGKQMLCKYPRAFSSRHTKEKKKSLIL